VSRRIAMALRSPAATTHRPDAETGSGAGPACRKPSGRASWRWSKPALGEPKGGRRLAEGMTGGGTRGRGRATDDGRLYGIPARARRGGKRQPPFFRRHLCHLARPHGACKHSLFQVCGSVRRQARPVPAQALFRRDIRDVAGRLPRSPQPLDQAVQVALDRQGGPGNWTAKEIRRRAESRNGTGAPGPGHGAA